MMWCARNWRLGAAAGMVLFAVSEVHGAEAQASAQEDQPATGHGV